LPGAGVPSDGAEAAAEDVADAGAPDAASGEDGEQAAMINAALSGTMVSKKRMGNETFANA